MKKLMMFAAAMTIVGGAYATCSPTPTSCALVYNVKLNLKTSMGKGTTGTSNSLCAPGNPGACVRFPNFSYVVDGYLAYCDCDCDGIMSANDNVAWCTKLKSAVELDFTWNYVHVIGNQAQAEALWALDGEDSILGDFWLIGAGFGTYRKVTPRVFGSFSGYAVGEMIDPICLVVATSASTTCALAGYWDCIDLTTLLFSDTDDSAPLFGSWAMKLNAAASKSYEKSGYSAAKLPPWL